MSTNKRWSEAEDSRLLRQVKAFPQNLNKCFLVVAEELDRTPSAVAGHWYTVLSKKPEAVAFFTVSAHHKCMNRKNGKGEPSSPSVFRRILRILGF